VLRGIFTVVIFRRLRLPNGRLTVFCGCLKSLRPFTRWRVKASMMAAIRIRIVHKNGSPICRSRSVMETPSRIHDLV
jgi:hypothetical protein